ncbi:MAG: hypothetical protein KA383_06960 [Phycisphaerae bacterium]|nr:hypothetical protein [Phycisphaerae bacterium]
MKLSCRILILLGLTGLIGVPTASADPNQPFVLVNVIDLYEFFSAPEGVPLDPSDPNFPSAWNPASGPPPNYALYRADPRLGTNPGAITVDGDRLWISGYHNGYNYEGSTLNKQLAWYNSLGVGEVQNILTTSGFDGSLVKFLNTVHFGPGIRNTDSFTGIDLDPVAQILYVAFDDIIDLNPTLLPPGADPQVGSYIAAVDVDPNSPAYGQFLWQLSDPFHPFVPPFEPGDRFYGGVAVDPLDPTRLFVPQNGGPAAAEFGFRVIDATNPLGLDPNDPATRVNIKDIDATCPATFYRGIAFDAVTGDMFVRNANAAERIPRNPNLPTAPFRPAPRFIEEPAGGNGVANTVATGDDVQLIPVNGATAPGANIIAAGANGLIDSIPAGDDVYSATELVNERPIGNKNLPDDDGECNEDPVNGFPNGPFAQGQGLAVVSASNLVNLTEDLVVANNRPTFGGNQLTDIRFFNLSGAQVAQLPIPCSPLPSASTGLAYYDLDYDETGGTLVVCSLEDRLVYVFKAQTTDGPAYPQFDYTRNGVTDMRDFWGFQACFTGSELPPDAPRLSLNCMRMNTDSDCDVDIEDFWAMEEVWNTIGGP